MDKYNKSGIGNDDCRENIIDEVIADLIKEYPYTSENVKQEWKKVFGKEGKSYNKLCDEVLSTTLDYEYGFCRAMEKVTVTEIVPGYWIEVKEQQGVFKEVRDDKVVYAYSVYELNEDGTANIFKLEWETQLYGLKDFTLVGKPYKVSQQVIKLIN